MSLGPLYVLLGKVSVEVLCPFFNWIVFLEWSCLSSLYSLDINSLWDTLFANIFSHSVRCLFICCFFWFRKAFSTDIVPVKFCFWFLCFWCPIKKIIAKTNVKEISPLFSSRSFIVLGLMFKSLTHFKRVTFPPWNTNPKEPMHPNVHSSTIYNSQVLEAA